MCQELSFLWSILAILLKIGVINSHRNGIGVDLNSNNPMRSLYPMIELLFFPCAVLTAALYEYLGGLSAEDEKILISTFIQRSMK